MGAQLPVIVLVHGAWHTPIIYASYIKALEAHGLTVHCPHLPSCNGDRPPTKTLADDVATIHQLLKGLVNEGHSVILVMHSYGGLVGTDAASTLTASERKAANLPGGVIKLIYLAGYLLPPGDTVRGIVREAGVEHLWSVFVDDYEDGTCMPKDSAELFYNGVAPEFVQSALPHLVAHPLSTFASESKGDAWRTTPTIYVATLQDHTVPSIYQDIMLKKVKAAGVDLQVETFDTGHTVFVTKEQEMVDLVKQAAYQP